MSNIHYNQTAYHYITVYVSVQAILCKTKLKFWYGACIT